jgi:hypothetical protein
VLKHTAQVLIAAGFLFIVPVVRASSKYYVDCNKGNDANHGTAPSMAWKSINRANEQSYRPGDTILLSRGCVWSGPGFKAQGNGTVQSPITLADYGEGSLPEIDGVGVHEAAVLLENVQNWIIRNLDLTQHGQNPQQLKINQGKDQDKRSDEYMRAVVHVLGLGAQDAQFCGEECTVRNIRLENLKVHDGSWNGIYVSGGYGEVDTRRFGYVDNVVVTGVESWNNHKAGIDFTCTYYKTAIYATTNVQVLDSNTHDNGGDGIIMGPVRNGLIDGNVCAYNGRLRNARLGCWTWDSLNTTVQFNESHHNVTPLNNSEARDGGGFDLDLGTEDGVLQYNWSHDNEGEGFLLMALPIGYGYVRGTSHNAVMRYNIGERDGKKLAGGVTIYGGVAPAVIYNNTIYYEADRTVDTTMFNKEGGALTSSVWGDSGEPDLRIYNNIFITNGTTNPEAASNNAWIDGAGAFRFDNNIWWRVEGGIRFVWGDSLIKTWTGWQEKGFDRNGLNTDPQLQGPLGGGPAAYRFTSRSPVIGRGRMVTDALRKTDGRDYFGDRISASPSYDIGAVAKPNK